MAVGSVSSSTIGAVCCSGDTQIARAAAANGDPSIATASKAFFLPSRSILGAYRLSYSSSCSAGSKFGSVLSVSSKRTRQLGTHVRALDPDFYKIPYVEGIPVGKRLKLWNIPPNCDHGEFREWLDSIPDVNVESLEFTDDPELNAQGVGGFVEYGTKQEACMAIVRLDGRKFKGRCIRMDFVEKRPHEREIGGRRNRPSRNYARDRSYTGGSYSSGGYAGSTYAASSGRSVVGSSAPTAAMSGDSGIGMHDAPNTATAFPGSSTFDAPANSVAPNWSAPPPPPRAYGPSSHRIFVGNMSWNIDDNGLFNLFRNHGNVLEARVMRDRETGSSRGFGFVAMSTEEEMKAAIAALDGTVADGRPLKVSVASR
ncbi:hypothetical protein KP509_14G059900 [Ceratopteris richardii]|uniref:RRM domain-containing protein n=1 Tax=Ceratopteris richardii TaxID=49495 RepID=A0A8T2TC80_CERRI|nr:hypothetical protein KP509_14G059900 [Ceratopteris richardii]